MNVAVSVLVLFCLDILVIKVDSFYLKAFSTVYGKCEMKNTMAYPSAYDKDGWKTPAFRQSVVSKLEELIQRSCVKVTRSSTEMENHVFMKAKTREEYMSMIAKLILHVREISQSEQNQGHTSKPA